MSAAAELRRLAVLLAAGVPPSAAWGHLARGPSDVARAVSAVGAGHDIVPAIRAAAHGHPDSAGWTRVGAAWRVATIAGAPLAATLTTLAESLEEAAELRRDVDVAVAGPRATSRLVLVLPLLGLASGVLLGLDPVGTLLGTVPGLVCLVAGGSLVGIARRWNRRLLAAAADVDAFAGFGLDLLAIGLAGGASTERAIDLTAAALAEAGLDPLDPRVGEMIDFARSAGVAVVPLLRAEARERRRDARATARRRAAELGTRLLLPLGACVLPAFVALGVVPLLLTVLASTAEL